MFFKKKKQSEEMVETSVGLISKTTLKKNPEIVKTAFNKRIKTIKDSIESINKEIAEKINDIIKKHVCLMGKKYGKCDRNIHYTHYYPTTLGDKEITKIKKKIKLSKEIIITSFAIDEIKRLEQEKIDLRIW